MKPLIRPPALRPGDAVGVFTPSSPSHVDHPEKYQLGLANLGNLGFRVVEGSLTARKVSQGYRAGTPQERAAELMELVRNPEVKAVFSMIGGSNSSSLIPYLDFDEIRAHPKIYCGFSDVTSIHLAILAHAGLSTFYGPAVVPSWGEWPEPLAYTRDSFLDAAMRHRSGSRALSPPPEWSNHMRSWATGAWKNEPRKYEKNPGWKVLNPGEATAPIVAANLNTLVSAAGTPYFPKLSGNLLMIEEMAAPMSRLERNFRQLERIGVFEEIRGLIFGKPEIFDAEGAPFGTDALLLEIVGTHRKYPIVSGFDCGHTHPMLTIAEMARISLAARGGHDVALRVEEPMVT